MNFTKTTNPKNALVVLALAGTLVMAPALILGPQLAQAQQAGRVVQGSAVGQVICPEGSPGSTSPGETTPERIDFSAQIDKNSETVSGTWNIVQLDSAGEGLAFKRGSITGGEIQGKQFTFTGIEEIDELCLASTTGTTITITGECGKDESVQFSASNGETGEFVGNLCKK